VTSGLTTGDKPEVDVRTRQAWRRIAAMAAPRMCEDLVAFAGDGDVPSDLGVFVEDQGGTDLAKC
jgi:hypothetical protein